MDICFRLLTQEITTSSVRLLKLNRNQTTQNSFSPTKYSQSVNYKFKRSIYYYGSQKKSAQHTIFFDISHLHSGYICYPLRAYTDMLPYYYQYCLSRSPHYVWLASPQRHPLGMEFLRGLLTVGY